MARRPAHVDHPDDEILPASPSRRRSAAVIGCLFVVFLLAFLIWFIATHSATPERPSWFGT